MSSEENGVSPKGIRIAYVDHSYHQKTQSTAFVPEILARENEVDCFWDESWRTMETDTDLLQKVAFGDYDVVVLFQVFWPPETMLEFGLSNVVMIPMFDAVCRQRNHWWVSYSFCRILNFSTTIHRKHTGLGIESKIVQYFPEPSVYGASDATLSAGSGSLRGFFWQRTGKVPWSVIRKLIGESEWEEFFLHWAPDPGHSNLRKPDESEMEQLNIRLTEWFETRDGYLDTVKNADVYFAPRDFEGIGMGFLEAMALGKCVVAPNTPTHNEYIVHGENGLLYDLDNPEALDFSKARELGEAARETCLAGWETWKEQQSELVEFVRKKTGESQEEQMSRQIQMMRHELALSRAISAPRGLVDELRWAAHGVKRKMRRLIK